MTAIFLRSSLTALACIAVLALATPSMAAMVNLKADLKASNEVPPNDSKGTGSVSATFDTDSKKLSWKGSLSGLSGPVTAAHFHVGEAGKNGAIAVPIADADKGSFEGSATLTDAQVADLMGGKWYVNIHTAAHRAGEIRGQMIR